MTSVVRRSRYRMPKSAVPSISLAERRKIRFGLEVPDPITFTLSEEWLNRRLYPRQATLLKVIFLRVDMLTDYDRDVIAEWEANFVETNNNGITPNVINRMHYLRALGYKWFREVLLVLGRRAGKGLISAIAMAYVLWNYMAKGDPQEYYGIDRDKRLMCLIYAGKKEQARDHLWRDLVNVIQGGPCFAPYLSRKPLAESLSIKAPADVIKEEQLAKRGIISGIDNSTFRIEPKEATTMSGRGGASFMLGFDEFAHVVASGANRSGAELYVSSTPSLDQFKKDAFIIEPSSPWEMIGQYYQNWLHALEVDEQDEPTYPEMLMLQLASWEIYYDWEKAHEIQLFPDTFIGDLKEYEFLDEHEMPRLEPLKLAIQEYDDEMKRLEKSDPDVFAVERLSHWQTTLDAYLDPARISDMFGDWNGAPLQMTLRGGLGVYFKGHADPSKVNDMFGLAIAHLEKDPLTGYDICIFDYIKHWDPADFPDHTIDYIIIIEEIWDVIKGFPIDNFTFDQFNSAYFIAELNRRVRVAKLPKRIAIGEQTATAPHNLKVAEHFKVALNQGWIRAPFYEQANNELRFLQFKNGKVVHQDQGPVQHDDVARSMMEVVFGLLENQIHRYRTGSDGMAPLTGTMSGGVRPWMSQPNQSDNQVFSQFQQLGRDKRMGPAYRPGRGPQSNGRLGPGGYRR